MGGIAAFECHRAALVRQRQRGLVLHDAHRPDRHGALRRNGAIGFPAHGVAQGGDRSGTGASPATVAYLGWFGPRGLASIVFAVIVIEAAVPHTSTIVDATALTVIASIVLHGFSAGPLTERYVNTRKEH